jgi:myo-inositol-1(or 4)-monophosphatase
MNAEKIYKMLCNLDKEFNLEEVHDIIKKNKCSNDFVTDVDRDINTFLEFELKEIKNLPVVSEENNVKAKKDYWVIDPIDGTTNLIHGYPSCCISIALVKNGKVTEGCVFNIFTKEMFVGIKGKGSYLCYSDSTYYKRLNVSKVERLGDSLLGFGFPYDRFKAHALLQIIERLICECHDLKRMGPASLDICYVACGRLDGYYELDLNEWDYQAARLILEEAGGKLTNQFNEDPDDKCNILATNGLIHEEMRKKVLW